MQNPYEVLGIDQNANAETIKSAYRRLAKRYHPDLNPGDESAAVKFREVKTAYEELTRPTEQFGGFSFASGEDFQRQVFEQMFRRMQEAEIRQQNANIQTVTEITLLQAFMGCEVDVVLRGLPGSPSHRISIPAGIETNQRIHITGAGLRRNAEYPAGDLFVVVVIAQDDRFVRIGDDLVTRKEIDALEAILGKAENVVGIDGETIPIAIRPGIQFGERIRIDEKGMVGLNNGRRGNLIIEILITTPVITEQHRNLIADLTNLLPPEPKSV